MIVNPLFYSTGELVKVTVGEDISFNYSFLNGLFMRNELLYYYHH